MTVERDRRAVLVALRLSDGGVERLKWLYRGLEAGGAREAERILGSGYGAVEVMSGGAVTAPRLVERIGQLGARPDVDAVDVVLVVHGLRGRLQFGRGEVRDAGDLAADLRATGASPKLRLLYSSACYGATHADAFVEAGFRTVIGALEQNTTGLSEFRRFLRAWVGGTSASVALGAADRPVPRWFWDTTARIAGRLRHVNSRKRLRGDGALVISASP
jgi:hypothetical protein